MTAPAPEPAPPPAPEPFVERPQNTFRENIVLVQGIVMVIIVAALIFLIFRLGAVQDSNACNIGRAATAAATQQDRASLGAEGRAAATALANSVIAAADSPKGLQVHLVQAAERTYATVMIQVNGGLAANPVIPVVGC